ncbi:hypothetical protein DNTS_021462 [Danionella cerebrum]|uniref:Small ribosomal subunit protein uS7m n=1 Tax=Danionella cerebrum TaxID=2873325 RepID=A0A553R2M9_9TELE|nr:hypothetical protein DNTS_021462 [Danionella translucida]
MYQDSEVRCCFTKEYQESAAKADPRQSSQANKKDVGLLQAFTETLDTEIANMNISRVSLCQMRWRRYDKTFLEPDFRKEPPPTELSPEEKELQELKLVMPIKAPLSHESSSPFNDPLVNKFINIMMYDGNKILSRQIMTKALESIKRRQVEKYNRSPAEKRGEIECNPYTIFHQAIENCKPILGLTTITKGGRNYQVPIPLKENYRRFKAIKWMVTECRENKHRRTFMYEKLAQELLAAYGNQGNVIKRKQELHKMAEANRAYAHYRW